MTKLTEAFIKTLTPKIKTYKKYDTLGLYIVIPPTNKKKWQFRYKYAGKENSAIIGMYPEITLKEARSKRDVLRNSLKKGINPSSKNVMIDSERFSNIAELLFNDLKKTLATITYDRKYHIYKVHLSYISQVNIKNLTVRDVLPVLKQIEQNNISLAHKVKTILNQIFVYAIGLGIIDRNIIADLNGLLLPVRNKGFAYIEDDRELRELLQQIDDYRCTLPAVKIGLQIMPYVFVRSKEMRFATWNEIDFKNKLWRIPASRMKMKRDHIVPLAGQVIKLFKMLHIVNGGKKYCFSSYSTRVISDGSLLTPIKRMGFAGKMTIHGFRKVASTRLHEMEYKTDAIEMQLAHMDGSVRGIYNKALHLEYRRKMMQEWADCLDKLKI